MYSVLMSVYAKENPVFFRESIESVMHQTYLTDDFVIVCDGPLTEELEEVLAEAENSWTDTIQVHRLPQNVGLGQALNAGLKVCKHEIVARMDSDDICFAERMEQEYALLTEKKLDIVSASLVEFSDTIQHLGAKRTPPETAQEIRRFARRRNPFNHPTVMYQKKSVEKVGGYQDFYLFEDYHLWVRMLANGAEGYNIQEPLLYMRTGAGMMQRRGGLRYVKAIWRFRTYLLNSGFSSLADFLITAPVHILVAIMPNGLRNLFYQKVLRK